MDQIDSALETKMHKILRKQVDSNFRVFEIEQIESRECWNDIETVELLKINNNRKEKSLEELCLRFIHKFIKLDNQKIQLDMVSYELGINHFIFICLDS